MIRRLLYALAFIVTPASAANDAAILAEKPPKLLSAYGLFADGATQAPANNVVPYDLATPLYSDYAKKLRFVYVPQGTSAIYNADDVFNFPIGTALIKSFGYDKQDGIGFNLIETRLLLRKESGWVALPYVWNEDKSDAKLKVAGKRLPVTFIDPSGTEHTIRYQVPNKNQCKSCHSLNGKIVPIGPKTLHLEKEFTYATGKQNQLDYWVAHGILTGLSSPRAPSIDAHTPSSGSLADRARTYLDVNCGHCHRTGGMGDNSGLFLNWAEKVPARYGIKKHPVAAGRGSGGLIYDIAPGKPDDSILIYRMASDDPGIAMPEIGRSLPHKEGIALIREWIESLK
ncbi:MAG: SO2930 family diheme c-type cytochrome [Alphaproteobacteria bacterium]